jgi:aminoglycoside phosphotransferase (APT) family kinase protein
MNDGLGTNEVPALDFDLDAFRPWFQDHTGVLSPLMVTAMRGGASCEMFGIGVDRIEWVVRRAPIAHVSATAHQVVREARIMRSLAPSRVPVPKVVAIEDSGTVLGSPFFVMEHLDGVVVRRSGLPASYLSDPRLHSGIGECLVDTLADLHDIDWTDTALSELSRSPGFLERQVDRWMSQLDGYRHRDLPIVDAVAHWLDANRPPTGDLSIMHGDYKLDNLMLTPQPPAKLVSLLDFEMTTVGDPLIDLAWALMFWPEEGNLIALAGPGSPGPMSLNHTQSPTQLVARYRNRTGRDLRAFDWYQAFSAWKLAIVLEGSYAKYMSGESRNPHHEFFGFVVEQLLARAERFAR